MKNRIVFAFGALSAILAATACQTDNIPHPSSRPAPQARTEDNGPKQLIITPQAIPGTPRSENDAPTGGYAPSRVQAQLQIDVREGTKSLKVIRDNTDPYVITKPYTLKHADPYAVRSYLEAAVSARSIRTSPVQVTAVKFSDGAGVILVSAEEYRFKDSKEEGKGIDSIVALLDRPGLTYAPSAETYVYFPRICRASNLRDMLIKVYKIVKSCKKCDPCKSVKSPGSRSVPEWFTC